MKQKFRLERGGLIDRQESIRFTFDGTTYEGYKGDTLASALLANGLRLVGRSFKYHRPRGIYTAGVEEMNALVQLSKDGQTEPNTRATVVPLEEGLVAYSQNRWPSLRFDFRAIHGLIAPLIPAGFYYKTFMWPANFWPKYEHVIRHAAGLGEAPKQVDADRYEKQHAYCDVLVVGAGPAGLSAALAFCRSGLRTILVDERPRAGGTLNGCRVEIDGMDGAVWAAQVAMEIDRSASCRVLTSTTAFGYYDHNTVALAQSCADSNGEHRATQRLWYVHATKVVLATGAIERPLIFGNNDLPGVMLANAAQVYCNQYAVAVGRKVLLATNNDSAYDVASDLKSAGLNVVGVIDQRAEVSAGLMSTLDALGIPLYTGSSISRAKGSRSVQCAFIVDATGKQLRLECDAIAVSGGWTPTLHLHSQSGGKVVYDDRIDSFVPGSSKQACVSVGAAAGRFSLTECLSDRNAFDDSTVATGHQANPLQGGAVSGAARLEVPPMDLSRSTGKCFVDIQDDVTVEDVELAARENFRSVEHLKRYTTLGMGTDQGKTSNVNGLTIMAGLRAEQTIAVGTTTFRPPYTPIRLGLLSGRQIGKAFSATRTTPIHDWHVHHGAVLGPVGTWLRPKTYIKVGETYAAAWQRECTNVREHVGIVDVSTLGKIEVEGPDAAEFLDQVYANKLSSLKVGKARYGIMLREDGMVFDDGTVARWSPNKFFITTTTANAAAVMSHFEYLLAAVWPDLRVRVVSMSDHYAQIALAGPRSRQVLQRLLPSLDVSDVMLPHMSICSTHWHGQPLNVYRVSYSGERSYELSIAAAYGEALWKYLLEIGVDDSIMPYGTEAMGALRIEKGHVAGPELDGRTTAADLGLAALVKNEGEFVGKQLLQRPALQASDRPVLVGLRSTSGEAIHAGAMLVPQAKIGVPAQGWVSSSTFSPWLAQNVALGFLKDGFTRIGETLLAWSPLHDSQVSVQVVSPCFYDPNRERILG